MSRKFFRVPADFSFSQLTHWFNRDFSRLHVAPDSRPAVVRVSTPAPLANYVSPSHARSAPTRRATPRTRAPTRSCFSLFSIRSSSVSIPRTQEVEALPGAPRQWDLQVLQTGPPNRTEELREARLSVRLDYFR